MTTPFHRRLVAVALTGVSFAAPARSEEGEGEGLELKGEATLGARIYALEEPFDEDGVSGFWDQYRYIATKDDDPAWFVDVMHLDSGLVRPDDTYLWRIERFSPHADNDRTRLDVDWRGLGFDIDYHRFRWNELRVYPKTTVGRLPTATDQYAVQFNADTEPDNPLGEDRKLWVRRIGFDSSSSLRPEDFGWDSGPLTEARADARYEYRKGRRQDRFLMDDRELGQSGSLQTSRFRAQRRELDQHVHTGGGVFVFYPWDAFTAKVDGSFESFREDAPVQTLQDIADEDPNVGMGFTEAQLARAFYFVPDTNRVSGSLQASRRFGDVSVNGSVFATHLEQTERRAPLQTLLGLSDTEVTSWSIHTAFDAPLPRRFGLNGYFKMVWRNNGFPREEIDLVAPPQGQVDPFIRSRHQTNARLEGTWRPQSGILAGLGYRLYYLDRSLEFEDPPGVIYPEVSLQTKQTEIHTVYLRSNVRLRHNLQGSAELGYQHSPRTGFIRNLKNAGYFDGRASWSTPRPLPLTLSAFGRVVYGKNNDIVLQSISRNPARTKTKRFEQLRWSYGLTGSAQLVEPLNAYFSWVHERDQEDLPHVRSNIPRYAGPPGLRFYRDSELVYKNRLHTLVLGSHWQASEKIDLTASGSFNWVHADFRENTQTGSILRNVNEIDARIISAQGDVGYDVIPDLRFEVGYRFDDFDDDRNRRPLDLDEHVHTTTLKVTMNFGLLEQ